MDKAKIESELNRLEGDYKRYRDPAVMLALKSSVFDGVWDIFSSSVISPEAAPFNIGRIYQAVAPYRQAIDTIATYEKLEAKLAATAGDVPVR